MYDGAPILCTDPWIAGKPYFGSWKHKFKLGHRQIDDITACEFVWFLHGHPDHLDPASIERFRASKILLPAHVGSRIYNDLKAQGYNVAIVENDKWAELSPKISILCLSDYNQDAMLLIDIGGSLLIDANDAVLRDWRGRVREIAKTYKRSFLLKLISHGDADMMNFFDESGRRVVPSRIKSVPLGSKVGAALDSYKAQFYVPFSTAHQYQRADSVWANEYVIHDFAEMRQGLHLSPDRVLPANYDLERDHLTETKPDILSVDPAPPEEFGDVWSDPLETADKDAVRAYFKRIESIRGSIDFVTVRVGGEDTHVELANGGYKRGIIFEAPRKSLMAVVLANALSEYLLTKGVKPG